MKKCELSLLIARTFWSTRVLSCHAPLDSSGTDWQWTQPVDRVDCSHSAESKLKAGLYWWLAQGSSCPLKCPDRYHPGSWHYSGRSVFWKWPWAAWTDTQYWSGSPGRRCHSRRRYSLDQILWIATRIYCHLYWWLGFFDKMLDMI